MHFFWQPADIVMAFDHRSRVAGDGHGFYYIGVQRALSQEFRFARTSVWRLIRKPR